MKCWVCKRVVKTAWRLPFTPNDRFRNVCDDCVSTRVDRNVCGFVVKVYP